MGTESRSLARRFRIAMVAASPFPFSQGSQVLIAQLSEALHRRGHAVRLVAYHTGEDRPVRGIEVHRVPSLLPIRLRGSSKPSPSRVFLDLLLARELLKVLRHESIDVIHTHNIEGLLVGLFVRCCTGVPVVYHVHNLMAPELHTYFDSRLGRWIGRAVGRWIDHHLPQRADCCIALSSKAASALSELDVPDEKIRRIPPGIAFDMRQTPDSHDRRADLGACHGLGDGPIVLYTGNLDRYQDIDLLLESFQRVASRRSDVQLVIASHSGEDFDRERSARIGREQRVHLIILKDLEALRTLLHISAVVVSPRTVCFGFPIKILNYMAAGKPIVASVGSAQGLCHMENGWVVPNGDREAFARAILTLLEDRTLADRLGSSARQTAARAYTWERAVAKIEGAYETLVEG